MRKTLRQAGYSSFTDNELWQYHAYDYGWRRVYLFSKSDQSPIDPQGQWFNGKMTEAAEKFFRANVVALARSAAGQIASEAE